MRKILNIIALPLVLFALSFMAGCEENIEPNIIDGSDQALVYVNTTTPENVITVNNLPGVIKQFVSVYPPTSGQNRLYFKLPAFMTKSMDSDVEVSFELDRELFENYNALSTVTSKAGILPEGVEVNLGSGKVTIPAGKTASRDSIEMTVTVPSSVTAPDGLYVIPVKIASVSGGAQVASNVNTIYVPFYFYASNTIDNRTTVPSGSAQTSYTGWSVLSSSPALTNPTNMLNTTTGSNNYASLTTAQPLTFTVDMGSVRSNVAGFSFYVTSAYSWSQIKVETSTDNTEWTEQGSPTVVIAGTNFHYIAFRERVPSARYVRISVLSWPAATTSFRIYYIRAYW